MPEGTRSFSMHISGITICDQMYYFHGFRRIPLCFMLGDFHLNSTFKLSCNREID